MSKKPLKKLGRASEWDEKYCEQLIEHMGGGLSFESFSAVIGVHRATLYRWADEYPSFCDAKRIGTDKNLLWWEKQGRDGLWEEKDSVTEKGVPYASRTLNNTIWIFNMKNRHKWRDKENDTDIHIHNARVNVELPDDELEKRLEEKKS